MLHVDIKMTVPIKQYAQVHLQKYLYISLMKIAQDFSSGKPTYFSLIVINLLPIAGVLLEGWNAMDIVLFYWLETIVIGIYNVFKIRLCNSSKKVEENDVVEAMGPVFVWLQKQSKNKGTESLSDNNSADLSKQSKGFLMFFFLIHYNFFIFIQLFFILGIDSIVGSSSFNPMNILKYLGHEVGLFWLGILGLFISHGFSFYLNFYKGKEYANRNPAVQMFQPYGRIFIQQFVVILGAMVSMLLGSPLFLLIVLVVIKLLVDLIAHKWSHSGDDLTEEV
jgi:hypothetical protein